MQNQSIAYYFIAVLFTCGTEVAASSNPQTLTSYGQSSDANNVLDCHWLIIRKSYAYHPIQIQIESISLPEAGLGYLEVHKRMYAKSKFEVIFAS